MLLINEHIDVTFYHYLIPCRHNKLNVANQRACSFFPLKDNAVTGVWVTNSALQLTHCTFMGIRFTFNIFSIEMCPNYKTVIIREVWTKNIRTTFASYAIPSPHIPFPLSAAITLAHLFPWLENTHLITFITF
jgi:hypothetical protein